MGGGGVRVDPTRASLNSDGGDGNNNRYLLQLQLDDLLLVGVGLVLPLHVALPALLLGAAAISQATKRHDITQKPHGRRVGETLVVPLHDAVVVQLPRRRQHDGVLLLSDLEKGGSREALGHVTHEAR